MLVVLQACLVHVINWQVASAVHVWWMFFETIPTYYVTSFKGVGTTKHLPKYQVYELALTSSQSKISSNESLENAR